ncbi:SGNH/GDSL hydrolase family protein [Lactobacillus sp. CBA3605]|uniref:SGNH/GDSL hydrolase family protein n=1 Tax=Lactobacillus sp. CBA3605 TaxID=2099788 RepID=UPI000CFD44B8|nr:SGNH/GDSL hydrolase family protein [Lactobacillus sp. CBA3605]AVK62100.1 SGNH/GDSL hydrolase family protein [Lactobacillus sp. CBA3605]
MKNKATQLLAATATTVAMTKLVGKGVAFYRGNRPAIASTKMTLDPASQLQGERIAFLGSSITYGAGSFGDALPEYLAAHAGVKSTKAAVSGTTLGGDSAKTYTARLQKDLPTDQAFDLFVCQLSTNDTRFNIAPGKISASKALEDFDRTTTIGAMEYIIAYAQQTWNCPVAFFTCLRKPDPAYAHLIKVLYQLQKKWGIQIIDVWNNDRIRIVTASAAIYMVDDAHPTRAGYRDIWLPFFEQRLTEILAEN